MGKQAQYVNKIKVAISNVTPKPSFIDDDFST